MRLGLIGVGRWGRNIARTVQRLPGMRLEAVATRRASSAALVAPATCYPDWRDLLGLELDGLLIASAPRVHCEQASAAIEAGLPVLVEKPLSLESAEAERLVALTRQHRGLVMVDHTQLFAPGFVALEEQLRRRGAVPLEISLRAGGWGPFRAEISVLADWGAHDIAIALHLLGSEITVAAAEVVGTRRIEGGIAESAFLKLHAHRAGGLVEVRIAVSNVRKDKERVVEVRTSQGTAEYREYPSPRLQWRDLAGRAETIGFTHAPPLDRVLLAFAQALRIGEVLVSGVELGAQVVALSTAAERIARRYD